MFRALLPLACLATTVAAVAGPIETVTLAAMRLKDSPNYSWTAAVEDDARSYVKQGKYTQAGYAWVTLPIIESLSRRLGREAGDEVEAMFGANDTCVIRLGNRWKTVKQLPKASTGAEELCVVVPPRGIRTPDMPADATRDPFPAVIILAPPAFRAEDDPDKPFSNARLAASPPHEELALIVSSWANVTVDGNTVRGGLTDIGARLLLCPGPETESTPLAAAGEFTLHLHDNRVTRYQLKLEGILLVGKKKKVLVHQISDTAIKDVGTTTVAVPDEARLNLAN